MSKEEILKKVFGESAKIERPLMGGMMNESLIVSFEGKKYVLYLPTKQANEMVDRKIEKEDQAKVQALGITSNNFYFDENTGIKANEFIEGKSLNQLDEFDVKKVAKTLKTLHNSNILAGSDYNPFGRFLGYEAEAKAFVKDLGNDYQILHKTIYEFKEFLEKQKKVFCHNDYQRSNIVRSDKDEYFMIDFEFTGNNDPIYDIATFGNGSVKEGYDLLVEYFGKPSKEEKMRYYLWRIFVSLQWHLVALVKHYRGEGKTHGMNFLDVASFFMENAKEAYRGYLNIK